MQPVRLVRAAALVVAVSATAVHCRKTANKAPASDLIWEPAQPTKQDDFDGVPLPESSEVPTATQITPAVVNIGQRYGVPEPSGKKKQSHVEQKEDFTAEHVLHGASLLSSTTAVSLGVLALLVAAGKALLLALAAVTLTCLSSAGAPTAEANAVYEVIAQPQYTHDHRGHASAAPYQDEPYSATLADYGYGSYAPP